MTALKKHVSLRKLKRVDEISALIKMELSSNVFRLFKKQAMTM
jgi:hypothetical protein